MKPVKLKDIVDEMEMQLDEYRKYLNKKTSEVVTVTTQELSIAEDLKKVITFQSIQTGNRTPSEMLWI